MNKKNLMNNICFIPTKGNSRRLPRKNILSVGGKPLVVRAVESALDSGCFNRVCVSSNDKEILKCARNAGAEAIERSEKLCVEGVTAQDVVWFHLNEMRQKFDFICMLMPTTPLRNAQHIKDAFKLILDKKTLNLVSVCEYEESLGVAMRIRKGKLEPYLDQKNKLNKKKNRYPKGYHFNGAVYISQYNYFMKNATFCDKNTLPYIMDRISSVDVNTIEDLRIAEALARYFKVNTSHLNYSIDAHSERL